jgi:tetratricopeptide (TPR) repeat protein
MKGDPLPDIDTLWDFSDPTKTETAFLEILPAFEQSGHKENHAELLTQIARTLGLQRRFDEAKARLQEADRLIPEGDSRAHLRLFLERGRVENSSGNAESACPYFEEAFEMGKRLGEENLTVDAAHMLAIAKPSEEAVQWSLLALEMAEKATDPKARRWAGPLLNNLGWTYHDEGRFEEALDCFERALKFRIEAGDPGPIRIARWCVARTLRSLGRLEEALSIQRELMESGEPDGYVFEEMAECLLSLGKNAEAKTHFAKAYDMLKDDRWIQKERLERMASFR